MSKSLGNSPDPIKLIEKYGADGVRTGMLLCAPAGNDLLFDEKLCEQGRNFTNKIWNALNLLKTWTVTSKKQSDIDLNAIDWFQTKLNNEIINIEEKFQKFKLSEALMIIYKLVWNDFCAWYLEMIKPEYGEPMPEKTYNKTVCFLESLMKILHPFMPFISEEVFHKLKKRPKKDSIMIAQWPEVEKNEKHPLENSAILKQANDALIVRYQEDFVRTQNTTSLVILKVY